MNLVHVSSDSGAGAVLSLGSESSELLELRPVSELWTVEARQRQP